MGSHAETIVRLFESGQTKTLVHRLSTALCIGELVKLRVTPACRRSDERHGESRDGDLVRAFCSEGLFYVTGLLLHESDRGTRGPLRLVPSETLWILARKLIACGIVIMPNATAIAGLLMI